MTTDTVKSWIEERRTICGQATEGPWVAEYSSETGDCVIPSDAQSTREAVAMTRLFHRTADANAIADAHNNFGLALEALERVLELHKPVGNRSWRKGPVCQTCTGPAYGHAEWPCATVQAIEGVIDR